jgi:hypothetical protein
MTASLSYAKQARLAFLGAAMIAVAALLLVGASGWQALSEARDDLSRLQRLVQMPKAAPADSAALPAFPNTAEAGSALQASVNRSAEAHGFRIENLQLLEPEKDGGALHRVALRANGVVPEQGALPLLLELSQTSPPVFVRVLELQKVPEMALIADGEQQQERLLALRVEFVSPARIAPAGSQP